MKIKLHKRNSGLALWLALLLFIMFLVFIGTLTYVIVKAIKKLPKRPTPSEEVALVADAQAAELASLQAAHPGETVRIVSATPFYVPVPAFVPFNKMSFFTLGDYAVVERSTNLLTWEPVATLGEGDEYYDTNLAPCVFYRAFYNDGSQVAPSTNAGFRDVLVPSTGQ